jgi:hypothetical protein
MRIPVPLLICFFLVCISTTLAEAQPPQQIPPVPVPLRTQRTPAPVGQADTLAIHASIGQTATRSQFLGNGLEVKGGVEGYVTPRVSIRGQVGASWWDIAGLSYAGSIQPVSLVANVVYNWRGEDWRPYVTGGGGLYRYAFKEVGVSGSKTKGGVDVGAGVEYFVTRRATITGEGLFHKVGVVPTNRAVLGFKGSFWSFAVGAKKYF